MKRAITLAGGGPAAGLHIGALEYLDKMGMKFDVWALSCIGAWVGLVYNQSKEGKEVEETYDFFRNGVFRDDVSYSRFPVNTVFGTDWVDSMQTWMNFVSNPKSYENLFLPDKMVESFQRTMNFMADPKKWNKGDYNRWILNEVLAVNPAARFWASLMFLSGVTGLSRIYYPDSEFLKAIDFEKLYDKGKPYIFHNAWNLTQQRLELFANQAVKNRKYKKISAASLCACSALPYIEETVQIDDDVYCEGALVDTVNFRHLIEDHPDLDEIWINRIVDADQIRKPENLHDGLANLCQLFAATVGEDDVKLFKYHLQYDPVPPGRKRWAGTIVEIHVASGINFHWDHENLDKGREQGRRNAEAAYKAYMKATGGKKNTTKQVKIVRHDPVLPS